MYKIVRLLKDAIELHLIYYSSYFLHDQMCHLYFFYKGGWWVSRLLVGVPLGVEIRLESVLTDVWIVSCTTEKPKHSAAQQQRWRRSLSAHLPLKRLMCTRSPLKRSRFPSGLMSVSVFCTLGNSHLLKLSWTYKLIPEVMPLGVGTFALTVAWRPFLSAVQHPTKRIVLQPSKTTISFSSTMAT